MLPPFLLTNIHFTINFFAALVFFAMWWLYFDAWLEKQQSRELPRILGLLLIAVSYVLQASLLEAASAIAIGDQELLSWLAVGLRIIGYVLFLISLVAEPLQKQPATATFSGFEQKNAAVVGSAAPFAAALPALALIASLFYWRRATKGLERHLRLVAVGFFVLALAEAAALAGLLRGTTNVAISQLVAPYGPLWITEHVLLFLAAVILARWIWKYLLKRFDSQLFIILTTAVLTIFVITTTTFTALLLRNLRAEALARLTTDVKVLNFTLDSLKATTLSDAELVAQNPQIRQAVRDDDIGTLASLAQSVLLTKEQSFLVVVRGDGAVLARGQNTERIGDSLSDDPLVGPAILDGQAASTIVVSDGAIAPQVSVQSVTPFVEPDGIIGAVLVGTAIDNAFVDGLKRATDLDAAVYGKNLLSATTLTAADGTSRWVGITQQDPLVNESVLDRGELFSGPVDLLNTPYFAAYLPLLGHEERPVGMLFVGRPQVSILEAANRSLQITFFAAAILMVLSIIPSYVISQYIIRQLR